MKQAHVCVIRPHENVLVIFCINSPNPKWSMLVQLSPDMRSYMALDYTTINAIRLDSDEARVVHF